MSVARSRSFTLVEVLVALGLGALLVAGVQVLVVRAYQTSQRLEQEGAQRAVAQLPIELLRADLAAQPIVGGIELRDGVLSFDTLCDLEGRNAAIRHTVGVRYRSDRSGDSLVLRRSQRELGVDAKWPAGVVVAEGLKAVDFGVFDGQRWEKTWPSTVGRSARALRITLAGAVEREAVIPLGRLEWRRHDE